MIRTRKLALSEEAKENKEGTTNDFEEKKEDKDRKVKIDKELQFIQQLSEKKKNDP